MLLTEAFEAETIGSPKKLSKTKLDELPSDEKSLFGFTGFYDDCFSRPMMSEKILFEKYTKKSPEKVLEMEIPEEALKFLPQHFWGKAAPKVPEPQVPSTPPRQKASKYNTMPATPKKKQRRRRITDFSSRKNLTSIFDELAG